MSDIEGARAVLDAARRDVVSLAQMTDESIFPLEVFGFHAQQAVEKSVKALLCLDEIEYPRTHNIRLLTVLLGEHSRGISIDPELVGLTAFAVQFRYEAYDLDGEEVDRTRLLEMVKSLFSSVEKIMESIRPAE